MSSDGVTGSNLSLQNVETYLRFKNGISRCVAFIQKKITQAKMFAFKFRLKKLFGLLEPQSITKRFTKQSLKQMKLVLKTMKERSLIKRNIALVNSDEENDKPEGN